MGRNRPYGDHSIGGRLTVVTSLLLAVCVLLPSLAGAADVTGIVLPGKTGVTFTHNNYVYWSGAWSTHVGTDIIAPAGTTLYPFEDGVVFAVCGAGLPVNSSQAGTCGATDFPGGVKALGNAVMIHHPQLGLYSIYLHMQDPPTLALGAPVTRGATALGKVGATGAANGSHVHFEIRRFSSWYWNWPPANIYCPGDCRSSSAIAQQWENPQSISVSPTDKSLVTTSLTTTGTPVYWLQNNRIYRVTDKASVVDVMQNASLQGWVWASRRQVSSLSGYSPAPEFIERTSLSNGLLIRVVGTSPVYLIENGQRRHVTSEAALLALGRSFADVIEVPNALISAKVPTQGPDYTGPGTTTACNSFFISPGDASAGAAGGSKTVTITGLPSGCVGGSWSASGNGSWLTVFPTSGSGSSSTVVSWGPNSLATARFGSVTIALQSFTVSQAGTATGCTTGFTVGQGAASPQVFLSTYDNHGGRSTLGCPTNAVHAYHPDAGVPDPIQDFSGGSSGSGAIMQRLSSSQAFAVFGQIWTAFVGRGGAPGYLGYPVGNEGPGLRPASQVSSIQPANKLRFQNFEGGSLEWHTEGAYKDRVFFLGIGIRDEWLNRQQGASGSCGLPITDEYVYQGGKRADFEGGYISWTASGGAVTSCGGAAAPPRLVNISTRGFVSTGDSIQIGGFIVGGAGTKKVLVRGRGPSMAALGVAGTLANPAIRLYSGATATHFNDDWQSAPNASEISASGQAPSDSREAAILSSVSPGVPYTVHVTGVSATTGIAIVEVFELDKPEVPLLNISTRGPVLTGDHVMIGGFIIQGGALQVLIVAKGPSLGQAPFNVAGSLADPTLELYQAGNPVPIETNDNWVDSPNAAAIQASGNVPTVALESAIIRTLAPGAYTAIVKGKGAFQGIGLVEVYKK